MHACARRSDDLRIKRSKYGALVRNRVEICHSHPQNSGASKCKPWDRGEGQNIVRSRADSAMRKVEAEGLRLLKATASLTQRSSY